MNKNRLEAFSDGVIAILITIMVLNLKTPQGSDLESLKPVIPLLLSYVLSFIYLGIYWNNHHHLLQAARTVTGRVLWANLHLLFWLSLVPFATEWLSVAHFRPIPVAFYGGILIMSGIAYYILSLLLVKEHGSDSALAKAIGHDTKGKLSVVIYGLAIGLAFVSTRVALVLYVAVAVMWFVPDRRIEKTLR